MHSMCHRHTCRQRWRCGMRGRCDVAHALQRTARRREPLVVGRSGVLYLQSSHPSRSPCHTIHAIAWIASMLYLSQCRLRLCCSLAAPLPGVADQLLEGAGNDGEPCAGCPSTAAWQVAHADWCEGIPGAPEFVEHLGIDHRAACLHTSKSRRVGEHQRWAGYEDYHTRITSCRFRGGCWHEHLAPRASF